MSFTSQNYGAGKWKRIDRVVVDCMALTVVIMLALGGGAYVFGHQLLGIYTSDVEVIACGMEILLYTTVTYFLCGLMDLFPGAMRGMGYSLVPMIISIIGTVGLRIVWIFWVFPEEPFAGCIVHFLSGIVDSYNSHAACLLLVCKKESVQEIKIRIQAQIKNPGNETTKYNCKKREK